METEDEPPGFVDAIGAILLRGILVIGGAVAYAVVLVVLAGIGGRFNPLFAAFNYFLVGAAVVWVVAPIFKYLLSKFGSA